ncbi:RNA polymerase sigma factor [Poriferisphaera sp. WC338]|uniref:RNA polymerase sigma factor n=1 Tax=Poriferisphaera sp. WC338 TaxID=3425129 RepID=UPI003D815E74
MAQTGEKELLAQIKKGNQAVLATLLKAQQARLYNVVFRMVGNRDDAAEITQETFLKIIQNITKFRGDAQLSTWMTRIAMNQSISFLRKQTHRRAFSLDQNFAFNHNAQDDQAASLRNQIADPREPSPHASVEKQEALNHLQAALHELEDDFRAILILRDIEQMDYKQISQTLDTPVGTVKSRLFRARLALRQAMQDRLPDGPQTPSPAASTSEVKHD